MRVDCGQIDPSALIRPFPEEWYPRMPERLDMEELADWRAGRNAVYQLAALTIDARLAVTGCIRAKPRGIASGQSARSWVGTNRVRTAAHPEPSAPASKAAQELPAAQ